MFDLKSKSLWPIFHGPVTLIYIFNTTLCMNVIFGNKAQYDSGFDLQVPVGHRECPWSDDFALYREK